MTHVPISSINYDEDRLRGYLKKKFYGIMVCHIICDIINNIQVYSLKYINGAMIKYIMCIKILQNI